MASYSAMSLERDDTPILISRFAIRVIRALLTTVIIILIVALVKQLGYIGELAESTLLLAAWTWFALLLVVWSRRAFTSKTARNCILFFAIFSTAGYLVAWSRDLEVLESVLLIGRRGAFNRQLRIMMYWGWVCALAYLIYWLLTSVARSQDELERRVADRTAELELTNRRLEEQVAVSEAAEEARQRSEHQGRELNARLTHMNRAASMGEMATALAHEVNQPLGVIANLSNACRREMDGGAARAVDLRYTLQEISREVERAAAVIRRLRTFVTKAPARTAPAHLNDLVDQVLSLLRPERARREVAAETILPEGLPPVDVDAVQIQQVLVNLVRNAMDALQTLPPEERRVEIATMLSDDGVAIHVTNHGPVLSAEQVKRMFEPYYTTKEDGLGMGLNISQSIVAQHRGKLTAEALSTGGVRIRVWLPLAEVTHAN